jgi:hypothetical protein
MLRAGLDGPRSKPGLYHRHASKGSSVRASRVIGIAVLVITLSTLTGCRLDQVDTNLPGEKMVYCTIIADPPIKDDGHIDASGRYRCDGDGADSIKMTVSIQRHIGDHWKSVSSKTWTIKGINTSRSRTETTRTRTVQIGCASNEYRTTVHGVERSRGLSKTFDYSSVGVTKPCSMYRSASAIV